MYERFKQLAEQAGMTRILDEHAHEYGNGMLENTQYPELEKFAELIVQECIELAGNHYDTRGAVNDIKQHFGVE
jgi:hypothetical protein